MSKKNFTPRDNSGVLFYDAPGVPTLAGNVQCGKKFDIKAEPATDKNQAQYTKITGDKVMGALYPNDRKQNERQPDFIGPITVDGKELRVSAWTKQVKNGDNAGQEFMSLAISEKLTKPSE